MPPTKYKFNPDSLSFDRIRLGIRTLLFRSLAYFVGSVFIALIYWTIFAAFFDSPKEKALKREVQQMTIQYELIHREMADVENVLVDLQKTDDNLYRSIFEAEPIPSTLRDGGIGGVNRYEALEGFNNSNLVIETANRLDKIRKKIYVQSKSFDDLIKLSRNKEEMLKCLPAIIPISNKDLTRTASGYGMRIHPIYRISKFHYGMDFTAPLGTDIYATANGTVQSAGWQQGYGNCVQVNHGYGYVTLYGHMSSIKVRIGQPVKRGEVIGLVGSTGKSTGPHLHYEVHYRGQVMNPQNYYYLDLSPAEYDRMVQMSNNAGEMFD